MMLSHKKLNLHPSEELALPEKAGRSSHTLPARSARLEAAPKSDK
jgi:hypothetical protein